MSRCDPHNTLIIFIYVSQGNFFPGTLLSELLCTPIQAGFHSQHMWEPFS